MSAGKAKFTFVHYVLLIYIIFCLKEESNRETKEKYLHITMSISEETFSSGQKKKLPETSELENGVSIFLIKKQLPILPVLRSYCT